MKPEHLLLGPLQFRGWAFKAGTKKVPSVVTELELEPHVPTVFQKGGMMEKQSILSRLVISPLPVPANWYAIPLRLILGFGFFAHGYAKLARGPENFASMLHAIGLPWPELLGWATVVIEILGGVMILVGAFVPLATVPMVIVLLVATFTVHLPNGFSSIKLMSFDASGAHFGQPGYETDLLYVAGLLALCAAGAGPLSIDGYFKARREAREAAAQTSQIS